MKILASFLCLLLPFFTTLHAAYCTDSIDISNYETEYDDYYQGSGNFRLEFNDSYSVPSDKDGLYVDGNVILRPGAKFTGNVYTTGTVAVRNGAEIDGNVYAEGGITLSTAGNIPGQSGVKIVGIITGESCEEADALLFLPVGELSASCNDIFPDAAQSYNDTATLFMDTDTQILDSSTNLFRFSDIGGYYYDPTDGTNGNPSLNSCGTDSDGSGIQCGVTSPPSQALSSFTISENNNDVSFSLWDDQVIEIGSTDEADAPYNALMFDAITAGRASQVTFLTQDNDAGDFYQIDALIVQDTSTVKLSPAVYAVHDFTLYNGATIEIVGDGDVFLFVENINALYGEIVTSGDSRLYLIVNDALSIYSDNSLNALLYSSDDILLGNDFTLNGQVAASNVTLGSTASIVNESICDSPADEYYFDIVASENALTCEPHTLQVNVRDSNGDLATGYSGKITLTTSTGAGTWSLSNSGVASNFSDSGDNSGVAEYQFSSSDAGSVTFALSHQDNNTLTVALTDGTESADSQSITFYSALLKTQLSCVDSISECINTANLPFNLTITAVKENEESTLCESYDPIGIKFWSDYVTPDTGTQSLEIDGTVIAGNEEDASVQTLLFSEGAISVTVNYPDAGQVNINLQDSDNAAIVGLATVILNPSQLVIEAVSGNPAESGSYDASATGSSGFMRASVRNESGAIDSSLDSFDITVRAVIDCSDDSAGHCEGYDDNPSASNFSNEITLARSLIFPVSSADSTATLGSVYSALGENALTLSMSNGELTYSDLTYDEVGVLGLQATSSDYISTSNDITASAVKALGRFYPSYFALTAGSFSSTPVCSDNDFAYIGDPGALAISYQLEAYAQTASGDEPQLTRNYDAQLSYPVAQTDDVAHFAYRQLDTPLTGYKSTDSSDNSAANRILSSEFYEASLWKLGQYNADTPATTFNVGLQRTVDTDNNFSPDGPFNGGSEVSYRVKMTGIDGEKLQSSSTTLCDAGGADDICELGDLSDLRYGRLQAGNGYGSEHQVIRTQIEATYYNGNEFVTHADNCTTFVDQQVSADPSMDNDNVISIEGQQTTLTLLNSTLIDGVAELQFSALGSTGELDYFIRLEDSADTEQYSPWLLDTGNAVSCPESGMLECISGSVQFGLFRGNDRIIYRSQRFQ